MSQAAGAVSNSVYVSVNPLKAPILGKDLGKENERFLFSKTKTEKEFFKLNPWPKEKIAEFTLVDRFYALLTDEILKENTPQMQRTAYSILKDVALIYTKGEKLPAADLETIFEALDEKLEEIRTAAPGNVAPLLEKCLDLLAVLDSKGVASLNPQMRTFLLNRFNPSELTAKGFMRSDELAPLSKKEEKSWFPHFSTICKVAIVALVGLGIYSLWAQSGGNQAAAASENQAENQVAVSFNRVGTHLATFAAHPILTASAFFSSQYSSMAVETMAGNPNLLRLFQTLGIPLNKPCSDCTAMDATAMTEVAQISTVVNQQVKNNCHVGVETDPSQLDANCQVSDESLEILFDSWNSQMELKQFNSGRWSDDYLDVIKNLFGAKRFAILEKAVDDQKIQGEFLNPVNIENLHGFLTNPKNGFTEKEVAKGVQILKKLVSPSPTLAPVLEELLKPKAAQVVQASLHEELSKPETVSSDKAINLFQWHAQRRFQTEATPAYLDHEDQGLAARFNKTSS